MYSSLKGSDVIRECIEGINMAFDYMSRSRRLLEKNIVIMPAKFDGKAYGSVIAENDSPQIKESKAISKPELINLLHLVVENSFIQNGSFIAKQVGGIAIGSVASQSLANLTLLVKEWKHIEGALKANDETAKLIKEMGGYKGCARYVDDMASLTKAKYIIPTEEFYGLKYSAKETRQKVW